MLDKLRRHKAIAWDLDETLIDSAASNLLHNFIHKNPQIRHTIVTFRTHGYELEIWRDLESYSLAPQQSAFNGVFYPADKLYENFVLDSDIRTKRKLTTHTKRELEFLEWKGKICAENGLTVLIDDRTSYVVKGCDKHGIELFHPLDFL